MGDVVIVEIVVDVAIIRDMGCSPADIRHEQLAALGATLWKFHCFAPIKLRRHPWVSDVDQSSDVYTSSA
jgi:hypothetical protein